MYVSEYEFAASSGMWRLVGYKVNDVTNDYRAAINNNWMYMGAEEWTITRMSVVSWRAFYVGYSGYVAHFYADEALVIRPAFSLEASITYKSGSGSQSDPIIIN